MTELTTYGRVIYPGYGIPVVYVPYETLNPLPGLSTRFRLVLVSEGTCLISLSGRHITVMGPSLLCMDENDDPRVLSSTGLAARSIYFHPTAVNVAFTLERLRSQTPSFTLTESQDTAWFRAFMTREENYIGILSLVPSVAKRIGQLMDSLAAELDLQRDNNWPCRSRSFFMEILLLVDRVFDTPGAAADFIFGVAQEKLEVVSEIVLYLHSEYRRKLTVDELTKRFHMNRTTLAKRFTEATGQPVAAYLINLRIRLASSLLRDTLMPIEEVMEHTGFSDRSHFVRTFRKHLGCAPSEYRRVHCWMA